MHTEDPDVRDGTTVASNPTQDRPARARSPRFLHGQDAGTTPAPLPTDRGRRGSLRWSSSRVAVTMLCAVLATLLGVLVDLLEGPPVAVTAIIVAAGFGVLMANDAALRGRADH